MSDEFFSNIDNGVEDFSDNTGNVINEILGTSLPDVVDEEKVPSTEISQKEFDKNINLVLSNLKSVAKISDQASRDIYQLAKTSDHPRAYEVLATLLKTTIDANKGIVDVMKQSKDKETKTENNQNNITQNNYFSTTDIIDNEILDVTPENNE